MKKLVLLFLITLFFHNSCFAWSFIKENDAKAVTKLLKSQVRYANRMNFKKFINTYDSSYVNSDGFDLEIYSNLIKDIWQSFDNIKYAIEIKDIHINDDEAIVELIETSFADLKFSNTYDGELKSSANTVYKLKKIDGKWKVVSDKVLDETTSMLYGLAKNLDIKLTVPKSIRSNEEYCATLEFEPPNEVMAIASIASDVVEYPQKPTQEVFRVLPEDNILERLFISNNKNANEYIVASIGLTKTSICDLNLRFNLVGFGYHIKRINVEHLNEGVENVKAK